MNNKTYTILQSFDKYEVNRLRKFLQSPYFNMNEAIVALFEIFIKDIFSQKSNGLEKEKTWERIYTEKKYDDVRFRKLNSELLKLVEKFLAQQVYEENPIRQATHLIGAVGDKKLEKLYNSTMKTAKRLSEQQVFKPASYYFYQFEIERNFYELTDFDTKRKDKSNIETIAKNLDYFYLAEKLRIYCSALSRQRDTSYDYEIPLIEDIIESIEKNDLFDIPPIAIYYQIHLTYVEFEEEQHYFKLKELITRYIQLFPLQEANRIYTYATNYCVRKINIGNQIFLQEYFKLYQELLDNEMIFVEGKLNPWVFRNIVVIALRLGKYVWTENFIMGYSERLPENSRDNAVTFNMAQLHFYQKNYDKVIQYIQQVEYEDPAYNLNSKLMLIAVYYETDEIEPLYSLFESFRVYLNRNKKISVARKKLFLNLIKFTKKLTKIIPGDKQSIKKLKAEINETKNIASLKWLKEKIAELE